MKSVNILKGILILMVAILTGLMIALFNSFLGISLFLSLEMLVIYGILQDNTL